MNRVCSSSRNACCLLGCLFVCLFLPGRCVYKLHYSKVKHKGERNARTFTPTARQKISDAFRLLCCVCLCFFVARRCVYNLYYSEEKHRREKTTRTLTHTRAQIM